MTDLPFHANFVCAGLAACTAEIVYGCPVNMCKIQMQLQGGSLYGTFREIVSTTGFRGLWRGIHPSLHRQLVYGQLRIGIYNSFVDPSSDGVGEKMMLGVLSGAFSAAIANPFDLMLVKQQAEHSIPKQKRLYHMNSFNNMKLLKDELGIRGMFRLGVGPTVLRAAIVTCFEQATYTECKNYMITSRFKFEDNVVTHLVSSFVAGLVASIATCPIDVVKTHVMTAGDEGGVMKKSLELLRRPLLLYRGFVPYYLKVGPWAMVMFVAFEQYKRLFRVMSDMGAVKNPSVYQ